MAYKLALPATSMVHPVFHVSQLKRAVGSGCSLSPLPDSLNVDLEVVVNPEKVLGVRSKLQGKSQVEEVLISWHGLPESEATWEDGEVIKQQFPMFHLEDKVKFVAGGNVMHTPIPPVTHTYARWGSHVMNYVEW